MAKNRNEIGQFTNGGLTDKRLEIIAEIIEEKGYAKKYKVRKEIEGNPEYAKYFEGISYRYINRLITFPEDHDILDQGHVIKGRSTLVKDGKTVMEWVKTSQDHEQYLAKIREAVDEMTKGVKPYEPVPLTNDIYDENLLNQYTITDYHLGMMAWAEEAGGDWNEEIAEELLLKWFSQGLIQSPNAEQCVFAQIGDFLHFDGLEALTPTSKNILDASVRYPKLVRISIRVIRRIIDMLLRKYKAVHVIMAEGNHDIASSVWLRELFNMYYELDPRVTIDVTPFPYYCYLWGKTALFYHHGHKKKLKDLDKVFVSKYKEEFGASSNVYGHTGHFHHDKVVESSLMILEQHRTLSSPDAHSSRGGWDSGRDAKIITYHKNFGEVGRSTISPRMLGIK